jgi:rubrerythrin
VSGRELAALQRLYPEMMMPYRCDNGTTAVVELGDAYTSYKRKTNARGEVENLFICECCAAEEGHLWEDDEPPDLSPVCRRKQKAKLR